MIGVLQVLHFLISSYLRVDVFKSFHMFLVHGLLGISPVVGVSNVESATKKVKNVAQPAPVLKAAEKDVKKSGAKKKN